MNGFAFAVTSFGSYPHHGGRILREESDAEITKDFIDDTGYHPDHHLVFPAVS